MASSIDAAWSSDHFEPDDNEAPGLGCLGGSVSGNARGLTSFWLWGFFPGDVRTRLSTRLER